MSATPTSTPNPTREFWYEDGDVILSCYSSEGRHFLYRVHKFMLTRYSVPFAEMLNQDVLELREGLPVLQLAEPAMEIYKLLCCLYNALNGGSFRDEERPIVRYDWLLRMCLKYKITPLYERTITQLQSEYPLTLVGWDAREAQLAVLRRQHAASPNGRVHGLYLDDRLPDPVMTIKTAHTFRLIQLLPAAFYDLARCDPRFDWEVMHIPPKCAEPENQRLLAKGARSARWAALSAQDLLALAALKETLSTLVRENWDSIKAIHMPHAACDARRNKVLDKSKELAMVSRDPLYAAQWACKAIPTADGTGMCKTCEIHLVKCFVTFRAGCWARFMQGVPRRS